jgi:hypothetical protein
MVGLCLVIVTQWLPKSIGPSSKYTLILCAGLAFLCGIGTGVAGMVREERLRWLPAIGFGFNLVLILLGFTA